MCLNVWKTHWEEKVWDVFNLRMQCTACSTSKASVYVYVWWSGGIYQLGAKLYTLDSNVKSHNQQGTTSVYICVCVCVFAMNQTDSPYSNSQWQKRWTASDLSFCCRPQHLNTGSEMCECVCVSECEDACICVSQHILITTLTGWWGLAWKVCCGFKTYTYPRTRTHVWPRIRKALSHMH